VLEDKGIAPSAILSVNWHPDGNSRPRIGEIL
jgi:hypothetical protein